MVNFLMNISLRILNIFDNFSKLGAPNKDIVEVNKDAVAGGGGGAGVPKNSDGPDLAGISDAVKEVLKEIAGPILLALGSIGVIYMLILGVQYAKGESDDKRAAIKRRIVNLAIGVLAIFALATVCLAVSWDKIIPELFSYMKQ